MRSRLVWFAIALMAMAPAAPVATRADTVTPVTAAVGVDDSDRSAFRRWFTYLADVRFERRSEDVTDCAALVCHAYREALRPHTPEWFRRQRLPQPVSFPDVRHTPPVVGGAWQLFRVAAQPPRCGRGANTWRIQTSRSDKACSVDPGTPFIVTIV